MHLQHLEAVLKSLREHQLLAKGSKCEFMRHEAEFLGFMVRSHNCIMMPATRGLGCVSWLPLLYGVSFELVSDHASLRYLFQQKTSFALILRLCEFLAEFDFQEVQVVKGQCGARLPEPSLGRGFTGRWPVCVVAPPHGEGLHIVGIERAGSSTHCIVDRVQRQYCGVS